MFDVLHHRYRVRLVHLAALLVADPVRAEETVFEAYVRCYQALHRLRDPREAAAFLRRTVVALSRSSGGRQSLLSFGHSGAPQLPRAAKAGWAAVARDAVVQALHRLPQPEREAVVLRHFAELGEPAAADAMGCERAEVARHTAAGMQRLSSLVEGL
jgi:DNA-directed RNA polymerase specialized sigma24 family protein